MRLKYSVLLTCMSLNAACTMQPTPLMEKDEKRISALHHEYAMAVFCAPSDTISQAIAHDKFVTCANRVLKHLHQVVYAVEYKRLTELERLLTGITPVFLHPLSIAVIQQKIRDEYSVEAIIARVNAR
jgi:hypothetical protein